MPRLPIRTLLQLSGLILIGAGAAHVVLGVHADVLLGAGVSAQSITDAGHDSQNRFYGAMFSVCGALLILFSRDLHRYAPAAGMLLVGITLAGLSRITSVVLFGWPPPLVLGLGVLEVVLPPAMLLWLNRHLKEAP